MRFAPTLCRVNRYETLIAQLRQLDTESVNPRTVDIDRLSARDIVGRINHEDHTVATAVAARLDQIAHAAEWFADTIRSGHRVFYIGAGTSGRLGVLDAAECPPTFGTDPSQIVGVIAGGRAALVLSQEGVEDNTEQALADLELHHFGAGDMLIGLAASRRTPYTLSGLAFAEAKQCRTVVVVCNRWDSTASVKPGIVIDVEVGPEVITGSTRMKSGTAQKMVLNMISTTAMVLLGKTYGNLMIDLQARSEKLAARSRRIIIDLLDLGSAEAEHLLEAAGGSVKLALAMYYVRGDKRAAEAALEKVSGRLFRLAEQQ